MREIHVFMMNSTSNTIDQFQIMLSDSFPHSYIVFFPAARDSESKRTTWFEGTLLLGIS